MKSVTDPAILAQLNGPSGAEVTDPAILAQLNGGGRAEAAPETSQALGFEQAVGNFLGNAADMAGKIPGVASGFQAITGHPLADSTAMLRNPAHSPNVTPGEAGKFAGSAIPYIGTGFTGPLISGLIGGGLNSHGKTVSDVAFDAGIGGALGKGTDLALRGASKIIAPRLAPAVQAMMDAKIPLTPGQTLGGGIRALENKLTSWPIVGDLIGKAQKNSVQGFNTAVLNSALKPIGKVLPADKQSGRDAVDYVATEIGKNYDELLPRMTGVLDDNLQAEINNIGKNAIDEGANQATIDRFTNVMKGQVLGRAQDGKLTGDALKKVQEQLGKLGRKYSSSSDGGDQQLGSMIMDAHGAFNDMLERVNPDEAGALKAANRAYAEYVRIRRAAGAVGSKDGVFSAPQYANAVKALDSSAGKGSYARGRAFMQKLSDPANQVLPSTVPDSGTPGRALAAALLTGGLPLAPKIAVPGLIGAALYTKPAQGAARYVLGGARPAWAPAASDAISATRLPLSLLAASLPTLGASKN